MIQCILDWFKDNSDAITGVASVVAIFGFGVTIYQLHQTQVALKASNTYAIQKDYREMAVETMRDAAFEDFVLKHSKTKKYDEKIIVAANQRMRIIFNFYLSVFRQSKSNGISKRFAESIGRDFSSFLKNEAVRAHYDKQVEANIYDEEFIEMVNHWKQS